MNKLFILTLFTTSGLQAQVINESKITLPEEAGSVYVHRVSSDSLSTAFILYIKEEVAMHKHEYHSENVIVLEGTAILYLDDTRYEIKAGDIIFIPKNTWHSVLVTSDIPLKVISIQSPFFDGTDRIIFKNQ